MAINLLQMVEKVLAEEKQALLAWEIWQRAQNKKMDKLVKSKSKTPGAFFRCLD